MPALSLDKVVDQEVQDFPKKWAKEWEKPTKAIKETTKSVEQLNKTTQSANNTTKKQRQQTTSLEREEKKLAFALSDVGKKTALLKEQTKQATKANRNMAKSALGIKKSFGLIKNLLGAAGLVGGFQLLVGAVKNSIKIFKDYASANSELRGILNKTRKETVALRQQQKELGATTAFSATQVAKAQTELARLGVSVRNITKLTPSILNAAVAMGVEMADAASLVAGQLNAFGLEAKDGARVADVLTKATQISAFNFEKLKTALGVVSPAAEAVGATIEETTAILSAAVDANIDASSASTGLRNIFIELSDKGISWNQAMDKINKSTNKLKTANDLFGKKGAVVAKIIADSTKKIDRNTKALNNAAGAAKALADEQLDNLAGDLTLLSSAWEGFVLGVENGEGALANALRLTTQLTTAVLGLLTPTEDVTKSIKEERDGLNSLVTQIQFTNNDTKKRSKLIDELQKKYPDFLGNIDAETASNEQLAGALNKANKQFIFKIALAEQEQKIQKQQKNIAAVVQANAQEQILVAELVAKANLKGANITIGANDTIEDSLNKLKKARQEADEAFISGKAGAIQVVTQEEIDRVELAIKNIRFLNKFQGEQGDVLSDLQLELRMYEQILNDLLGITDESTESTEDLSGSFKDLGKDASKANKEVDKLAESLKQGLTNIDVERALSDRDFAESALSDLESTYFDGVDELLAESIDSWEEANNEKDRLDLLRAENALAIQRKADKEEEDARQKKKERDEEIAMASVDLAAETFASIADLRIESLELEIEQNEAKRESEIEANQLQLERQLADESLTEDERTRLKDEAATRELDINRKADREQAKIKRKQAQAEKTAALFQIAISTAVAIAQASPVIPLQILAAATGALQAALVAARPLPAFFTGVDSAPKEGIFGDKYGRELVTLKTGESFLTPDKATYFNDSRMIGATITPHEATEEILGTLNDARIPTPSINVTGTQRSQDSRTYNEAKKTNQILSAILNQPKEGSMIDRMGNLKGYIRKGNTVTEKYKSMGLTDW